MPDRANGYEENAETFMRSRRPHIGVAIVREWARNLSPGAEVLELGCGHGVISSILIELGLSLHAIDASPTLLREFQKRFPHVPTDCSPAEESAFFFRTFDGILAWGLLFLLEEETQRLLLKKSADALRPGGRLLFTAQLEQVEWTDATTQRSSRSLGAPVYQTLLQSHGLKVSHGLFDEGQNHYYSAMKPQ
jgi:cyclopropane fatty-acyl-phospholipid synthase-like methyltransferase